MFSFLHRIRTCIIKNIMPLIPAFLFISFFSELHASAQEQESLNITSAGTPAILISILFLLSLGFFLFQTKKRKKPQRTGEVNQEEPKKKEKNRKFQAFLKQTGNHFQKSGYAVLYTGNRKEEEGKFVTDLIATKGAEVILTHCLTTPLPKEKKKEAALRFKEECIRYLEEQFNQESTLHFSAYLCQPSEKGGTVIEPVEYHAEKREKEIALRILSI